MARCNLDLAHPKFLHSIGGDAELQAGLDELKQKISKDHRLCSWFNQPMPNIAEFQNKIWKWDCAPEEVHSSTRKKWRLLAYVPDPNAPEPIPAIAFAAYSKADTSALKPKEIAKALRNFLAQTIKPIVEEEKFRHVHEADGRIRSLCFTCFETVIVSITIEEIDAAEQQHQCS